MSLLSLDGVEVALGARRIGPIDLRVEPNELVALLGRNGAGKTSLIRVAAGITPPAKGTVRVLGTAPERPALAKALAYLPQNESGVPTDLTVRELLELGRLPHVGDFGPLGPADERAIEHAARTLGVEGFLGRRLETLSAGERQRAHVARCLAQDTPLVVLDEPTAALDGVHAADVLARLRERTRVEDRGALVVVHDVLLAARFSDRVALLAGSGLVASGPPLEVLTPEVLEEGLGLNASITRDGDSVSLRLG